MTSRTLALLLLIFVTAVLPGLGQSGREWGLQEHAEPREDLSLSNRPLFPPPFDQLVPFLTNFGSELDQSRRQGDIEGLLRAADLLFQAERLTGQRSPFVSGRDVLEEATLTARNQRDPEALRRLLGQWERVGDPRGEDLARGYLEEVEAERTDMTPRRRCRIIFHNRSGRSPVAVYLNGKPVGSLTAGSTREIDEVLAGNQHLEAYDEALTWGPRRVFVGPGEVFHWKLFD